MISSRLVIVGASKAIQNADTIATASKKNTVYTVYIIRASLLKTRRLAEEKNTRTRERQTIIALLGHTDIYEVR